MNDPLVLDTGAFVALVDRSEERHADCVEGLANWDGSVVTTEAVLTETLYLVGPTWPSQRVCLEYFIRGAFLLVPTSQENLRRAAALMEQYADIPMDFADATLVALSEELGVDHIFTLDRRGFSIYRLHEKASFKIIP